jgi:CubicO group peptidase (beta-lactamase class C family)
MNAPGMALSLADAEGVQRVAAYGFSDIEKFSKVEPNQLFQIGSISKSFLAILLLQLREEGKIDLNQPVSQAMPWMRVDSQFSPITLHHLLTHTSGLPDGPLFPSEAAARYGAAYAPGEHFHYSNMAYAALGHLVEEKYHGAAYPRIVGYRIFKPLGIFQSEAAIILDLRDRQPKSYWPYLADRPYPRHGRLSEAPPLAMSDASGCIAATSHDMGLYMVMLANKGRTGTGRLMSEESFSQFATPQVRAEEFGPTASYGYGIVVDTLDGHKILRHTGGMVSFASAMHVDVDEGVGAFASINAMQGYRPDPVAQYAIRLMRAAREGKPLPEIPRIDDPSLVSNAAEYAGIYRTDDGLMMEFVAADQRLFLVTNEGRIAMESRGNDKFVASAGPLQKFVYVFGRSDANDPKSPFAEVGYGGDLYTNFKYRETSRVAFPREWLAYVGHYRNESPWDGSLHIVVRKDKLLIDGVVPLEPGPNGVFFLRDKPNSPEWIQFLEIVNHRAMRLKLSGEDFWRIMVG